MVNLRASFDKAREKIRQATSKSTTMKLKGYSEVRVSVHIPQLAASRILDEAGHRGVQLYLASPSHLRSNMRPYTRARTHTHKRI